MEPTPERVAYSVKEVAGQLGVSQWTVREAVRRHQLGHLRLGARILIPRSALESFIKGPDPTDEIPDSGSTNPG